MRPGGQVEGGLPPWVEGLERSFGERLGQIAARPSGYGDLDDDWRALIEEFPDLDDPVVGAMVAQAVHQFIEELGLPDGVADTPQMARLMYLAMLGAERVDGDALADRPARNT
jgi:hypothetical protein